MKRRTIDNYEVTRKALGADAIADHAKLLATLEFGWRKRHPHSFDEIAACANDLINDLDRRNP